MWQWDIKIFVLPGKRKVFDTERLKEAEEERKKRHKEKLEIQMKILERLDKLIDKM